MQHESSISSTWRALSHESASAIEKVGRSVVAVHARRRIPASGVHWRPGIVVTTAHTLEREEEITVTLPSGHSAGATLAGRDPSTDLAILKLEGPNLPVAELGDITTLKVGYLVLAAGRTSEGGSRASLALVGVVGPAWQTWSGGLLDHTVRLDRNLHPNFSGGPAVDDQGRMLGINTSALSRYATVVIPASTVERVAAELEQKGHIGRGYLGLGMQPVRLPRKLRESLKLSSETGIMIMRVEPEGPADRAGIMLGDVLVALDASPVRDIDDVQHCLSGEQIGKPVKASIIRGGTLAELDIAVGERPRAG
jgi:S1-C subfamily serine protease